MRIAVTGTPGTGKTAATERLAAQTDLDVIHVNERIRERDLTTGTDEQRDSLVADLDAVAADVGEEGDVIESHLAHRLDIDVDGVVVLRCRPDVLEERLRERGESAEKAAENAESEALDVVLSEAVAAHGEDAVYEIDTTNRTPDEVAAEILAVVRGEREPAAGTVDFTDYL